MYVYIEMCVCDKNNASICSLPFVVFPKGGGGGIGRDGASGLSSRMHSKKEA